MPDVFKLQRQQHPNWTLPEGCNFDDLPLGAEDRSYRNDAMPCWDWADASVRLYIDYPKPSQAPLGARTSEAGELGNRYVVQSTTPEGDYLSDVLATDDWSEAVRVITERCNAVR